MGAFSHKFSIAPSSETTDRIKKVRGCKNGTDRFYHHAKIVGHAPAVDEKVRCFFCLCVTLWDYEVCDNGNAMKRCNFQNYYGALHRGRFVVVHLYSSFLSTPEFSH